MQPRAVTGFQFHIGAIRSADPNDPAEYKLLFQFHIGAIRSGFSDQKATSGASFNSILVQLEGATLSRSTEVKSEFQFHIGAIRSRLDFGWKVPVLLKSES